MHPTIQFRRYAPAKSVQSSYLTLSGCVLLSQGGPGVQLAWHRRQRQELRQQRCTARRIGGCENQCDDNVEQKKKCACSCLVRMMPPTILSRRYAPAKSVQSSYLTLSGCFLLSQGGPGVRLAWHRRQRQDLRRQRCTAHRRLRQPLRQQR